MKFVQLFFILLPTIVFSQETSEINSMEKKSVLNKPKDDTVLFISYPDAQFPGGAEAMKRYFIENVKIPDDFSANHADTCVRVYVQFVVDEFGKIDDVLVVRPFSPSTDAEVIRVIKAMPTWVPSFDGEKSVPTRCRLPVQFCTDY